MQHKFWTLLILAGVFVGIKIVQWVRKDRSVEGVTNQVEASQDEIARRYSREGPAQLNAGLQKVRIIVNNVIGAVGLTLVITVLSWATLARIFPSLEAYPHGWVAIIIPVGALCARYFWKRAETLLKIESEREA